MCDRRLARRLLLLWAGSTLILTLGPFVPVRETARAWSGVSRLGGFDFLANIALFLPAGVLAVRAGLRPSLAVAGGALFSLAIESGQTWLPLRHPSERDLLANAVGCAIGALLSAPLVEAGCRLWVRPVRLAIFVLGGAGAVALAWRRPELARYGFVFPFAVSVLGALVASGLWRPRVAWLLSTVGALVICAALAWPFPPAWVAACAVGCALGTWPAAPVAPRPAAVAAG